MKLIIDISEDDYKKVLDGRASVSMMRKAIGNGTPLKQEQKTNMLDKIKAEIERERSFQRTMDEYDIATGLRTALEIIDKYKAESLDQEPCDDCIKREDALMCLTGEWTESTDELIHRFIRRIRKLPPVAPAEKVGKWIYREDNLGRGRDGWYCNQCRHFEFWDSSLDMKSAKFNLPNFCPNCGAKMVEPTGTEGSDKE